jgi:hypothetical protein
MKMSPHQILVYWKKRWGTDLSEAEEQRFIQRVKAQKIHEFPAEHIRAAVNDLRKLDDIFRRLRPATGPMSSSSGGTRPSRGSGLVNNPGTAEETPVEYCEHCDAPIRTGEEHDC